MDTLFLVVAVLNALLFAFPTLGQGRGLNMNPSSMAALTSAQSEECARRISKLSLLPSDEAYLRTPQLIAKYGYPVETHTATSEDGFVLTLHRIPYGKLSIKSVENFPREAGSTRPAVLLHHGLLCTSADWFMQPEDDSLPFMLANAGYDVWLGNSRGNSYSNRHLRLNPRQLKYWTFSWHEMGLYDIPKIIDYILATSGEPKLYYVGHSMGGTMFMVAMALHPEYNEKIRSMYGFAPASFSDYVTSPLLVMAAPFFPLIELVMNLTSFGQLIPRLFLRVMNAFGPLFCAPSPATLAFCAPFFFIIAGFDPCQFNTTQQISKIVGHTPDSTSFRSLGHYVQLIGTGKFRAYDYGSVAENRRVHGQDTPPDYDLSKVTAKTAIFWGDSDLLVTPKDVNNLIRQLPNVIANRRVNFELWNHLDFTYGIDAKPLIYVEVMKLMARHY